MFEYLKQKYEISVDDDEEDHLLKILLEITITNKIDDIINLKIYESEFFETYKSELKSKYLELYRDLDLLHRRQNGN